MTNVKLSNQFQCRYFNKIVSNGETITKYSFNKIKLKNEYRTYFDLPDSIKKWFAVPFDFCETKDYASYTMKYYFAKDIAFQYVNRLLTLQDLDKVLGKLFYFIKIRKIKKISDVRQVYDKLYIKKLDQRVSSFKRYNNFKAIERNIKSGTNYYSFDNIVEKYKTIYSKVMQTAKILSFVAIGHGDLCFSNVLYDKSSDFMIFIDPKDFSSSNEMWINPYYDVAKLSHSICGKYDFFNNKEYNILTNKDLKMDVSIGFNNTQYIELFKKHLLNNGYDYNAVRVFEVSLFLSMLPLHIDDENKILGFILNAINIMEKVEKSL